MDFLDAKLACPTSGEIQLAASSKDWKATEGRPALTESLGRAEKALPGPKGAKGLSLEREEETGESFLEVKTDFSTKGEIRPAGAARDGECRRGEQGSLGI